MKIERISDNQIRCTLNKEDLEGKETLLSELAFGSEKAKGLFRELMNKAATELGFETNEDFREHYKKLPKGLLGGSITDSDDDVLADLPDFLSGLGKTAMSSNINNDMKHALADTGVGIFAFTSLDDVAFAAKLLSDYNVASTLYKDPDNQCYYLSLTALDDSPNNDSMDEIHLVLSEYCKRLPNTYATKALFNEHLITIIEKQAIEEMAA